MFNDNDMERIIRDNDGTEYICVEKKKAQEFYDECFGNPTREVNRLHFRAKFEKLIGDKKLLDGSESPRLCDTCANESYGSCKVNIGCDGALMPTDDRERCDDYKQPTFVYKVGDLVYHYEIPGVFTVIGFEERTWNGSVHNFVIIRKNDIEKLVAVNEIKPYIEKKNDMEIMEEYRPIKNPLTGEEKPNPKVEAIADRIAKECVYDPVSKYLKESLGERNMTLKDILWNCPEGEPIFSLSLGDVMFNSVDGTNESCIKINRLWMGKIEQHERLADGRFSPDGIVDLYPSRELYLKYPLDSAKAWQEWHVEKYQACRVAVKIRLTDIADHTYYDVDPIVCGFQSKEVAQQALACAVDAFNNFCKRVTVNGKQEQ